MKNSLFLRSLVGQSLIKQIPIGLFIFAIIIGSNFTISWVSTVRAAIPIRVEVANAPQTDLALTLSTLNDANQTLWMNAYQLNSPQIVNALKDRISNRVSVQILREAEPVGGLKHVDLVVQSELVSLMRKYCPKTCRYLTMSSNNGTNKRRFRFNHAKYVVVDGTSLLIGSENYTVTGHPVFLENQVKPSSKPVGNRGWEVRIHDSQLAREFSELFQNDSDEAFDDVTNLVKTDLENKGHLAYEFVPDLKGFFHLGFDLIKEKERTDWIELFESPSFEVSEVTKVLAPHSGLKALLELFRSARTEIEIEQMSFPKLWRGQLSPLVTEILEAARRRVSVRILLNDEKAFSNLESDDHHSPIEKPSTGPSPNQITVDFFNQMASVENLKIQARIANIEAMNVTYIHNKGVLIDGVKTLVGSMNWTENSIQNNRETSVVISSPKVFQYYDALFEKDWDAVKSNPSSDGRRP